MAKKVINEKNLAEHTAQEVFDYIVQNIFEQGEPSYDRDNDECRYRLGKLKCAAGHVLSDEAYKPKFETKPWNSIVHEHNFSDAHVSLIRDLQGAHDLSALYGSSFLVKFDKKVQSIANEYNLNYTTKLR